MLEITKNINISNELKDELNRFLKMKDSFPEGKIRKIEYFDESNIGSKRNGSIYVHFEDPNKKSLIIACFDKKEDKTKNKLYTLRA